MTKSIETWMVISLVLIFGAAGLGGCQSMRQSMGMESEPPPPPAPKYYDFPDVLIPTELSLDRDESVVYEYGGQKMGVLHFKGGVEAASLEDFFISYLGQEGWTLVNKVKFSRMMLNFVKENRICQILIEDKAMTTVVEVWVNPLRPG